MKRLIIALAVSATSVQAAQFVDSGADVSNFFLENSMTANSDGDVISLVRTVANDDAIANWYIGATTYLSLDEADEQYVLNITPTAQIGNGEWNVNILFFDDSDSYITDINLIGFSANTAFSSYNISEFATSNSVAGAESYFVRFRTQGDVNSGFSFTEIAAVPEPSQSALLVGALALGALAVRRQRRA